MRTHRLLTKVLLLAFVSFIGLSKANNVQITGTTVSGSNITFNISWENSWNASAAPANWDAVWVFIKYQDCNTKLWAHADLSTTATDHTAASPLQVDPVTDGKGVFIRRSAVGGGNISSTSITLKMSSVSGTGNNYKVYGIEMVNVPQGNFVLGDGVSNYTYTSRTITATDQANGLSTSELGPYTADVPQTFPMGYHSFYCMKYEISQEQYVDFLNSLTFTQQKNRVVTDPISAAGTFAMWTGTTYQYRNSVAIVTPGSNGAIPAVFGCDATPGTPNSSNDGQNVAMNGLSWADLAAYLDWAALRPMTEMEFEKVARGPLPMIPGEYVWGSTEITSTNSTALTNAKLANEISSTTVNNGMCAINNISSSATYGPLRTGIFATSASGRLSAGAGYYGAMELAGNVWERVVGTASASGVAFTGNLGDGSLSSTGFADQTSWPNSVDGAGATSRGSGYANYPNHARTSDRINAYTPSFARYYENGGRGVR